MRNWGITIIVVAFAAVAPAMGQTTMPATQQAVLAKRPPVDRVLAHALSWQIALEREGFSPGLLDGKVGGKTRVATEGFQRANGLPATGVLDTATQEHLKADLERAVVEYTVQASDLGGITPLVDDWNERAKQSQMGYYDALDGLAEKFHTSRALMQALNPAVAFAAVRAGVVLVVPGVQESRTPKAASLKVDLGKKQIMALDEQGKVIALFHCSIAAHVEKRPSGETKVIVVNRNPDYTFDPQYWPEVHNVTHKLLIPPGPRNPVGLAWIGLDLPGYGIHGTPHPEMIGKTGSHGCFRMTNWDAIRLSKMIRPGATVTFVAQ